MEFKTMLQDGIDGSLSSRRVITFLAFLLCAIAFIANMFFGYKVETYMFEGMIYIAMAGLGATVAEKFSSRNTTTQNPMAPVVYRPLNRQAVATQLPKEEERLI